MCELIEALSRWENEGGAPSSPLVEERARSTELAGEEGSAPQSRPDLKT
jgi:hypothetical protein